MGWLLIRGPTGRPVTPGSVVMGDSMNGPRDTGRETPGTLCGK
jgi:hypothetical protein